MEFEETDIPSYRNEYDDLFNALLLAWRKSKAVRVVTGKHPQSIRVALKGRLAADDATRGLPLTLLVNDDGCTVYINAIPPEGEPSEK